MRKQGFRSAQVMGLALLLALGGFESRAQAQQGKYLTQATVRLIKLIDTANTQGYSLPDNTFAIGGGWLKLDQEAWVSLYTVPLKAGKKYRFLAAGDADAKDVDLDVQDANGKTVAVDDKTDPEAVVDFTPTASGRYVVRIRLYDSRNNEPCVCLGVVMTHKD